MAVPVNVTQTVGLVTKKEEKDNQLYNIDPTDTPFVSGLAAKNVANRQFGWFTESLANPDPDNAVLEGDDDRPLLAQTPEQLLENQIQQFDKVFGVSDLVGPTDLYGMASKLGRERVKKKLELKRDIECVYLGKQASVKAAASVVGKTAGAQSFFVAATSDLGAGGAPGGFNPGTGLVNAPTGGTNRALTESLFTGVIGKVFDAGQGVPKDIYMSRKHKAAASVFAGRVQLTSDVETKTSSLSLNNDVVFYRSNEGWVHKMMINRWLDWDKVTNTQIAECILFIDPEYWDMVEMQPLQTVPLARTGHSIKEMHTTANALKCKNPRASGYLADLNA